MPVDLDELEARARKATPGPWRVEYDGDVLDEFTGRSAEWPWRIEGVCDFKEEDATDETAAFIAACSPDAILALIERARQAETQRDKLRQELEHLVFLMEPVEHSGGLNIPGLATLNGALNALAASAPVVEAEEETR